MASPEKRRFVGTSVKVRVLEGISRRRYGDGTEYGITNAVSSTTSYQEITPIFVSKEHLGKIHQGDYTLVRCSILAKGAIKVTSDSIVLETQIEVPTSSEELINNFTMPPFLQNINEVYGKQSGQRISIRGQVVRVSKVLESQISKRKVISIVDKTGEIEIKLWGELSTQEMALNSSMEFTALEVACYQENRSLNSTSSTSVLHAANDEPFNGYITAACFDGDNSSIFVEEELLIITLDELARIYPAITFTGKKMVQGYKKDGRVTFIEVVPDEEDEDDLLLNIQNEEQEEGDQQNQD